MKLKILICKLWIIYFVPIGRSSNVRAFLFFMFLMLLYIAAVYEDKPNMPPFEALSISEGIVDFTPPKKRGSSLILRKENSPLQSFACNGGRNNSNNCVPAEARNKYRGRHAKVWWFYNKGVIGTYSKLAQLEIDGEIIVPYSKQKESYEGYGLGHKAIRALFLVMLLSYILWMPLWHFSNQRKKLEGE
ncbi:MAG: hypothetical protein ACXVB6_21425 [Mucilaginibacter sp.]